MCEYRKFIECLKKSMKCDDKKKNKGKRNEYCDEFNELYENGFKYFEDETQINSVETLINEFEITNPNEAKIINSELMAFNAFSEKTQHNKGNRKFYFSLAIIIVNSLKDILCALHPVIKRMFELLSEILYIREKLHNTGTKIT